MSVNYQKIYAIVNKIPRGKVATYGQVARLAGIPRHARQVGYALHALRDKTIPWHRVINTKGEISPRKIAVYADIQRELLEDEGIVFNGNGKIRMEDFQWDE